MRTARQKVPRDTGEDPAMLESQHVTPHAVALCAAAEAVQAPEYVRAVAALAPMARRYGATDADAITNTARILLADKLRRATDGHHAAALAIRTAAATHYGDAAAVIETPTDTVGEILSDLPATGIGGDPAEMVAGWHRADTVDAVGACLSVESADTLRALITLGADACDGRGVSAGAVNVSALANALHCSRATAAARVQALRSEAPTRKAIAMWRHALSGRFTDCAGDRTPRDTTVPTSGPASRVVYTVPSGSWVTDGDRSVLLPTAEHVAAVLADTQQVRADGHGHAREELHATLANAGSPTVGTARRPAGVGADVRYGPTGAVSNGEAYADSRPAAPRKRKRDGAIGSPMVTGATSLGTGTPGSGATGTRPTAADALASRVAAMTPAQRARFSDAAGRAHAAAADLAAWESAPAFGKARGA